MKYHLTIALLFFCCSLFAQEASPQPPPKEGEKGVSPIPSPPAGGGGQEGATYAVVVGISDYQDEGIPDLRFADKDAEAFANFLRSPAGGGLDEDHLKVLVNEQATSGMIGGALLWLLDECKEGDQAIIYFSGHGDVERKIGSVPGFLLCWDSPPRVYFSGGTIEVRMLQDIVSTLSLDQRVKVIVITDACRSGKLAGSVAGGAHITGASLAQQFANETKILSCQPEEFSLEGEQWGGGRGAFSYHLVDGLYGLADQNSDHTVNLMEIGRYLEDRVIAEVAPHSQVPMTVGNRMEPLVTVSPELLEQVRKKKKSHLQMFTTTSSRGLEEEILATVEQGVREKYLAFKTRLEEKKFLEPPGDCADDYYNELIGEKRIARLHASMRRNYAAHLQDDAQQVMNRFLRSDMEQFDRTGISARSPYQAYPRQLRRAAELLGPDHYMYPVLLARSYWFEGYLIRRQSDSNWAGADVGKKAIVKYEKALAYQPEMPHAWLEMACAYGLQIGKADSAEYYANLALEACPDWVMVAAWMADVYGAHRLTGLHDPQKAKSWLDRGASIDSNSIPLLVQRGINLHRAGQHEELLREMDRAIGIDPNENIFYQLQGWAYQGKGQYKEAETAFRKSIELTEKNGSFNLTSAYPYVDLGLVYLETNRPMQASEAFEEAFLLDTTANTAFRPIINQYNRYKNFAAAYELVKRSLNRVPDDSWTLMMGSSLAGKLGLHVEAADHALKAIAFDPTSLFANLYLGCVYRQQGLFEQSERILTTMDSLYPDNLYVQTEQAILYMLTGRMDKAEQKLQDCLALNRDLLQVHLVRFFLYQLKEEEGKARSALEQAMAEEPTGTVDLMGRYCRFNPFGDHALSFFEKLTARYPDHAMAHFEHACYLGFQKKTEAAARQLESALADGLDQPILLWYNDDLKELRGNKQWWDGLVQRYFPEEHKN